MDHFLFLASAKENSGIPLPVMTIIAMLLLMLPYLIRRYTGRSVTEWLRFSTIIESVEKVAGKVRSGLFGKGVNGAIFSKGEPEKESGVSGSGNKASGSKAGGKNSGTGGADASAELTTAERNRAENERTRMKQRAGNAKNDYLRTVSEVLTFARKNHLFTVIPGNVEYAGQTAELTALLVTKARVVGILAYGFDGKVLCRRDDKEWQIQEDGQTRPIGKLNAEAQKQDRILKGAMDAGGLTDVPYQTAMVFTGGGTILAGDRPAGVFTREEFFEKLGTQADLETGPLNLKETGKRLSLLRSGKKKA